jgi:hypothetical protein
VWSGSSAIAGVAAVRFQQFQHTRFAPAEAERLAELRLGAMEDRVHAELAVGKDRELVPELEGLVGEQPLRERLWAALLLALYRAGRQADALRAYQRARRSGRCASCRARLRWSPAVPGPRRRAGGAAGRLEAAD